MRNAGFIFSLDAFVAFTLSIFSIGLLIFATSTPSSFYPSLGQAQQLAHDTLAVLAATPYPGGAQGQTYLGHILANPSDYSAFYKTAGGQFIGLPGQLYDPGIIPIGYGYRLEKYVFSQTGGSWQTLYDAGTHRESNRFGKSFTKLSASAATILSIYTFPPMPGESPFCYKSCQGYGVDVNSAVVYAQNCTATPCDPVTSYFRPGRNSIQMVRLVVYT